jgi:aspartate dehydrogenase
MLRLEKLNCQTLDCCATVARSPGATLAARRLVRMLQARQKYWLPKSAIALATPLSGGVMNSTVMAREAAETVAVNTQTPMKVAVAGVGAIGRVLVRKLASNDVPGATLAAVAARDAAKARAFLDEVPTDVPVLGFDELPEVADLVVECTPAALVGNIAEPMLRAGKKVMVLSASALLSRPDLVALAERHGGQIIVPTGALLGLDAVAAAAEGQVKLVRMVSRKPVKGLLGAPFLEQRGIDIASIREPLCLFRGTAREAATGFPANLNVAAALSLAGIGPDLTQQEIWADPTLTHNTHRITVDSDSARFEMTIENIPSENPKTGRITALSVIAALRKLNGPLRVGS